ncbi:MAG: hypothetical protein RXQ73_03655, partial [Caldivirga sp.]
LKPVIKISQTRKLTQTTTSEANETAQRPNPLSNSHKPQQTPVKPLGGKRREVFVLINTLVYPLLKPS